MEDLLVRCYVLAGPTAVYLSVAGTSDSPTTFHSDRFFIAGLDVESLVGTSLDQVLTWFHLVNHGNRPFWQETTELANVFPNFVSHIYLITSWLG